MHSGRINRALSSGQLKATNITYANLPPSPNRDGGLLPISSLTACRSMTRSPPTQIPSECCKSSLRADRYNYFYFFPPDNRIRANVIIYEPLPSCDDDD